MGDKLSNGCLDGEYDPEMPTEYPTVEITQCQIGSCEVMLNTHGRLVKQTSDLKITIVKFTYPGQSSYTPSLSLPHFLLSGCIMVSIRSQLRVLRWYANILAFFTVSVFYF